MNMSKVPRTMAVRRGHSMAEMVVVMSILVGMVALSWPMLKSPMDKARLQAAAQDVSTELSKARLKAMQSGVAQVFKVRMNSGKFRVVPVGSDDDDSEYLPEPTDSHNVASQSEGNDARDRSPLTDESDAKPDEKELPEGICFEESHVDEETSHHEQKSVPETSSSGEEWKEVAVFYPNGATTDAVVGLHTESNLHVDVKLSGLTRSAKVGETYRQELK